MSVIQLSDHRKETHTTGVAICIDCRHEWDAVISHKDMPEDGYLECPSCHTHKGRFKYKFWLNIPHWICKCGNDLMCVTPEYIYCPNCGHKQDC